MRSNSHRVSIALLLAAAVLLMSHGSSASGQSGRRPPKKIESPDPLPPKQEEPPIKPPEDKAKYRIPIKVAWYLRDVMDSSMLAHVVQSGCLERLSQSNSVSATPTDDVNRKQASDMAKASTDTYVLWFEFEYDTGSLRPPPGGLDPSRAQQMSVRYEVFAPGTGKSKTSGHLFQRVRTPGGLPLPIPSPGSTAAVEYSFRYMGREMADRLLDALNLPHPPERR
ncbi:MAG TPA: hypothetical protein VN687_13000 [Blastocatellia bacterium]|nr:hypothetical protein [Blastocatellia bacterium]